MSAQPNVKDLTVDIKYNRKDRVINFTQTTVTEEVYSNRAIDALIEQIKVQIKGYKSAIKEYQVRLKTYKDMQIQIKKDMAADAVIVAKKQKEIAKASKKESKKVK